VEPEDESRVDPRFQSTKDAYGFQAKNDQEMEMPEDEESISPASKSKAGCEKRGRGSADNRKPFDLNRIKIFARRFVSSFFPPGHNRRATNFSVKRALSLWV
jgi:hypothetical protein